MTATFILAFTQGIAAGVPGADPLLDGFGVIALVALAPLITLQLLGLISVIQAKKRKKRQPVSKAHIDIEHRYAIDTLESADESTESEFGNSEIPQEHEETLSSSKIDDSDQRE